MDAVLEIRGMSKAFGGLQAVRNFDLQVQKGDLIGIITTAGIRKFSGNSFGTSIERAADFLRVNGLPLQPK